MDPELTTIMFESRLGRRQPRLFEKSLDAIAEARYRKFLIECSPIVIRLHLLSLAESLVRMPSDNPWRKQLSGS